ncbi:MAG TPA: ARMT1-like domain-containing protein [Candidatus Deferrimicrobium sp.]|nr:ARMT1-like domain-containing protein [Candidatus Deferrimicrobium sp.]
MRAHLDCIPCFQRQALQAVRFITDDEIIQERILRLVLEALQKIDWKQVPPQIARIIHKIVRDETRERDPYASVKKKNNDIALKLYPLMKKKVKESDNPLFTAVKLAIAGNIIDFGARSEFDLNETIIKVLNSPLKVNHFTQFMQVLAESHILTYLGDNTGEIVFDKILLELILDNYKIDRIQFAVKGAQIINDATIEDAKYVGLDRIKRLNFVKIDIGEANTGFNRQDPEFLNILNKSDMIISKGQGNYESLSDRKEIFFLLIAKCPVIARDLGVEVEDIILKGAYP